MYFSQVGLRLLGVINVFVNIFDGFFRSGLVSGRIPLNSLRVLSIIIPTFWTKSYYNLFMGQVSVFVLINSSANPLVYYIASQEFKDAFKKIFKSLMNKTFFRDKCIKTRASLGNAYVTGQEGRIFQLTSNNKSQVKLINVQIITSL